MACGATLKRSLDFDPLHTVVSTSPSHAPIVARTPPSKRRRLSPRCGSVFANNDCRMSAGSPPRSPKASSPFQPVLPMSSEAILKNIFDEYKRMKRRRQLQMNPDAPSSSSNENEQLPTFSLAQSTGPPSSPFVTASLTSTSTVQLPDKKLVNTPLLTMKQVGMICERLLKEQEEKLRSEYDKVLVTKLSEQYDAFVKFNYDQVQRRLNENPASYVS